MLRVFGVAGIVLQIMNSNVTFLHQNLTMFGLVTLPFFIATHAGWLYLAILIDLFSRKVIGWFMSNYNNGQLVKDALDMAVQHHHPDSGLVHHTDRGSTYAMKSYRDALKQYGMISSMSRKCDCWDTQYASAWPHRF